MIQVFRELPTLPSISFLEGMGSSRQGEKRNAEIALKISFIILSKKNKICRKYSILCHGPWGFFGETGNFLPCMVSRRSNTFSKAPLSCLHSSRRLQWRLHVFSRLRCKPSHHTTCSGVVITMVFSAYFFAILLIRLMNSYISYYRNFWSVITDRLQLSACDSLSVRDSLSVHMCSCTGVSGQEKPTIKAPFCSVCSQWYISHWILCVQEDQTQNQIA